MKKLAILIFGLFLLNSCKKEAQTQTETSAPNSKEVSLVQDAVKLKNDKGEEISVTYFAEGSEVAVKLQKTGAKEVITIIKKEETKEETLEIDYPETDDEF